MPFHAVAAPAVACSCMMLHAFAAVRLFLRADADASVAAVVRVEQCCCHAHGVHCVEGDMVDRIVASLECILENNSCPRSRLLHEMRHSQGKEGVCCGHRCTLGAERAPLTREWLLTLCDGRLPLAEHTKLIVRLDDGWLKV